MFFRKRRSWLDGLYARSYRMKMGEVRLPGLHLYMVNEPEQVKKVMMTDVEHFPKHEMLGKILEPLLGESIFTTNGEQWRKQRDMLDIAFNSAQVERVYDRMQEATQRMLNRFASYQAGSVVNVDPEMTLVTADIIFRAIMSADLNTAEGLEVMQAFERFQAASPKLALLKMFKLPDSWLLRWADRKRVRDAKTIRASLERVIRKRYEAYILLGKDEHDDILSQILAAKDPDTGASFSFDEIVDQVAMLFLAGHETSASALTWTLYLLAISPEIQEAAAQEVLSVVDEGQMTSLSQAKQLSLVRRIFMEAMRLYPPVGFLARETTQVVDLKRKQIPAGASVVVAPWLLHRHEELWDDPHAFCPMRFDPKFPGKGVPKHAYLPYGAGERRCIGAAFANQEAQLILAELLRAYRFSLAPNFEPDPVGRLTIRSENGMMLILEPRIS
jgi:cytochrome P450